MDLSKLDLGAAAEQGATMTLRHPVTDEDLLDDKTGEPITITVMGRDSKQFRQTADRLHRARQQGSRRKEPTLREAEKFAATLLGAVTLRWNGIEWEGKPLECNVENATMLYTERPWIREQIDEFVGDAGNFYKQPKKT